MPYSLPWLRTGRRPGCCASPTVRPAPSGPVPSWALVRHGEFLAAADVLGVRRVRLADYPDGGLGDVSPGLLDAEIEADLDCAALLVVFDRSTITSTPSKGPKLVPSSALSVAATSGAPPHSRPRRSATRLAAAVAARWSGCPVTARLRSTATRARPGTTRFWSVACSSRKRSSASGSIEPDPRRQAAPLPAPPSGREGDRSVS